MSSKARKAQRRAKNGPEIGKRAIQTVNTAKEHGPNIMLVLRKVETPDDFRNCHSCNPR